MSICLSQKNGVKAKKKHHCVWCWEPINIGELYDYRCGVECGDVWTMRMHPECHKKENETPYRKREDWYEDFNDSPVFDRPKPEATT
jgi:hypothetical protein